MKAGCAVVPGSTRIYYQCTCKVRPSHWPILHEHNCNAVKDRRKGRNQ